MSNKFINSLLALTVFTLTYPAFADEITNDQVKDFLCQVQMCKNNAVISDIQISKYNLANLSEKLFGSGKQILKLSFHQQTANGEYTRDFTECNLVVKTATDMALSNCRITGTVKAGKASRVHKLSLGEGEIIYQNESGWMASTLTNQ
ncbi:MAG: hypothetical protein ACXVCP_16530 [Bdellovibrio sp.]